MRRSSSAYGSVSWLVGRYVCADGSASFRPPRFPKDVLSAGPLPTSSALLLFMRPLNLLSPRTLPNPGFFSVCGAVKLPKAPIGVKPPPCAAAHPDAALPELKFPVAVRFRDPSGPAFSAEPLSLSRSSVEPPGACSLKSVRRRTNAGGGVTALDSSRANLDADGDAKPLDGNGKASLVSRRRGPGRALVGEDIP